MDEAEKCNDVFVKAFPKNIEQDTDGDESQETDTHLRCRGFGSFNWRMKYPIELPLDPKQDLGANQLSIELWDFDLIGDNTMIGYTIFDLNEHNIL